MKISSLYIKLMKDKTLNVLEGLIEHLPQALIEFSHAANLSITTKAPGLSEFIPGLLAMEQTCAKGSKWRLHSDLLNQFACLVHCMTSEQIYLKFVPLLFKYISITCVLPVKYAASQTLCMIIRHNRKQEQREELCRRIVDDCAHSNKHKLRLLYVDICKFVMELFSKSFFKQYFCEALLELAGDPVANVRLSVSHLLPNIKRSLKLPSDRMLVQLFDQTLRMLYSMENDTDVCYNVRHTLPELNRIEIAVESLSRKTTFMEDDLLDQKKEQEEKLLLLAEEQDAKEGDSTAKGKQSTTTTTTTTTNSNKDKQKNPPAKRFTLKPIKTSPALNRKSSNNSLPSSPVLSSTTAPLRTTSSANNTPTSNRRTISPPLSGLANCLTSSSPSTSHPSSINTQPITSSSSPTSAGNSPVGVMKKAVTIPKIVTPTGSPGVQKKESYQSSRATKTPIPTETKSQPSLDSKSLLSSSPQSSRNSPSELRKAKLKDDKTTSRSAPSGSRRKAVSSTASTSGRSSKRT